MKTPSKKSKRVSNKKKSLSQSFIDWHIKTYGSPAPVLLVKMQKAGELNKFLIAKRKAEKRASKSKREFKK